MREVSLSDWHEEGRVRFGSDKMDFAWKCPSCGVKITSREYMRLGAPSGALAFSCIGRYAKDGPVGEIGGDIQPCNYAGGGLFGLNPVRVLCPGDKTVDVMEWWNETA